MGKLTRSGRWAFPPRGRRGRQPDRRATPKNKFPSSCLPLGAVAMSEKVDPAIAERDVTLFRGYTRNRHPVSCAAALKSLEILLGEGLAENAARSGHHLQRRVREFLDLLGVGNVRGLRAANLTVVEG